MTEYDGTEKVKNNHAANMFPQAGSIQNKAQFFCGAKIPMIFWYVI